MLNPLHAPIPGPHPQPSPYFSSSRIFRNPLYLCIDEVPGADGDDVVAAQRAAAVATDDRRLIDHTAVWAAKRTALRAIWARHAAGDPATSARVDDHLRDPLNLRYAQECARLDGEDDPRFQAWLQAAARGPAPCRGRRAHP